MAPNLLDVMDFLILFWKLVTTEDKFVIITKNWPQSNLQRQYQQYQWRNLAPKDIPHILPPISTSKVKNEALPDPCHPHLTRLCRSSNYNCIFRKQQMTQERCRLFCLPKYTQFDDGISKLNVCCLLKPQVSTSLQIQFK